MICDEGGDVLGYALMMLKVRPGNTVGKLKGEGSGKSAASCEMNGDGIERQISGMKDMEQGGERHGWRRLGATGGKKEGG